MEHYIGSIGVDSGQMMLCDPCYVKSFVNTENLDLTDKGQLYKGEFSYGGACEVTLSDKSAGTIGNGLGAVCSTGYGDGEYAVYVTYEKDSAINKRVTEMRIVFVPEEVECEECGYTDCNGTCEDYPEDDE